MAWARVSGWVQTALQNWIAYRSFSRMMASDEYSGKSKAKKHVWLVGRWLSDRAARVSFMCMLPIEGGSRDWQEEEEEEEAEKEEEEEEEEDSSVL